MINEDKELLLKDLCARLPYKVKVSTFTYNKISGEELDSIETLYSIDSDGYITTYECDTSRPICKPYLFPLSSMTEEQKKEYNFWKHEVPVCHYEYGDIVEEVELYDSPESFDYLIANHFDYYGLIPKGLAIDATTLNLY